MRFRAPIKVFTLAVTLLLVSCASSGPPGGGAYDEPVVPGQTKLLNLTGNPSTSGAVEVYFKATQRGMWHDKLLVFMVDGKMLEGAKDSVLDIRGYQAIALKPGTHTLNYCFYSKSSLGTGGGGCKFAISDYPFEAGSKYMVSSGVNVQGLSLNIGKKTQTGQSAEISTGINKIGN